MEITPLNLEGPLLVKPPVYRDQRGFFLETFQHSLCEKLGVESFVQDNHSYSHRGCIRGMHFQTHPGQAKLIRVAVGKIYDVAVDIRPHSPTYGQWEAVILDDQTHTQFFIPNGFAHGFCVLSEEAHVLYKVSASYNAATEKGFRWDDPQIKIEWPLQHPTLSERDLNAPFLHQIKGIF